jgi:hypothetical protein
MSFVDKAAEKLMALPTDGWAGQPLPNNWPELGATVAPAEQPAYTV